MSATQWFSRWAGAGWLAIGALASVAQAADELRIPLPEAARSAASLNLQVVLTAAKVTDQRHFEDQPKTADVPSLAAGLARAKPGTTDRAIGRARNAYGKALQNLYLDDEGTVQQVLVETVANVLRGAGYTVITDAAKAAPGAWQADVVIRKFWGWMDVPQGRILVDDTITMQAEIETEIGLTPPGGLRRVVTATAKASSRQGLRYMANWEKTFRLLMADYARVAGERLAGPDSRPDAASPRPEVQATPTPAAPAPPVAAVPPPASEAAAPVGSASRLRELQRLKDEGLITDDEYRQKRKAILAEL